MAEGPVEIRVYLPYMALMADKISLCNFLDTITQKKNNITREIQYFFNSTDKAIAEKQLICTSIVHIEYHFHVHSITPFARQVKIVLGG